jgi:hypothetical protein
MEDFSNIEMCPGGVILNLFLFQHYFTESDSSW